jgi:hypothetical protein
MTTLALAIYSAVGDTLIVTTDDGSEGYTTDYELETWDPQPLPIENSYAESQSVDGGDVSTSVRRIGSCLLTVLCLGEDLDAAWLKAVALQQVLEVDDGTGWDGDPTVTVEEAITARTTVTHNCFRASADIVRDPVIMEGWSAFRVTVTLPCKSRSWVQAP